MKKPLELTVYSTWTAVDGTVHCSAFQHEGFPIPVDMVVREKRLTEPELAAEYWSQALAGCIHPTDSFHGYSGVEVRGNSSGRIATLHRFATLPHYDEEPAG